MICVLVYTGCGDGNARMFDAKSGALKRLFRDEKSEGISVATIQVTVRQFSCTFSTHLSASELNGNILCLHIYKKLIDIKTMLYATPPNHADKIENMEKMTTSIEY